MHERGKGNLTDKEVDIHCSRYQQQRDQDSLALLLENFSGLAKVISKQILAEHPDWRQHEEDLVQEGILGIEEAVRTYKRDKAFSRHAAVRIRQRQVQYGFRYFSKQCTLKTDVARLLNYYQRKNYLSFLSQARHAHIHAADAVDLVESLLSSKEVSTSTPEGIRSLNRIQTSQEDLDACIYLEEARSALVQAVCGLLKKPKQVYAFLAYTSLLDLSQERGSATEIANRIGMSVNGFYAMLYRVYDNKKFQAALRKLGIAIRSRSSKR